MFQFPAFPPLTRFREMNPGRFPDLGDLRIEACLAAPRSFSQLCHVLHRLWTPRHPPCTLISLTTLFLNSWYLTYVHPPCFQRAESRIKAKQRSGLSLSFLFRSAPSGGGDRTRTDDRLVANQVLYQLSYAPSVGSKGWRSGPAGRPMRGGPDRIRTCDLPLIRRTL